MNFSLINVYQLT